jgi:hypothetical protein
VHHEATMPVRREEVADLLGDVDETIAERIAGTGATLDELGAALDDLDHERRFCERRVPASTKIAEVREILEEIEEGAVPGARVIDIAGIGRGG